MFILFEEARRCTGRRLFLDYPMLRGCEFCLVVGRGQTPGVNGVEGTAALRPDLSPNKDICIN